MLLEERITSFTKLGQIIENTISHSESDFFTEKTHELKLLTDRQHHINGWFTKENVILVLQSVSSWLNQQSMEKWLSAYTLNTIHFTPKIIGTITAGNIPLVGFHDFLCILLSGHTFYGKLSSQDNTLLPFLAEVLCNIDPRFKEKISFATGKLANMDAIIATGSNNSARYFDYYFEKYPHIIRKNRSSVAVLTGEETPIEIHQLGYDIFNYYGLGCRSVSKLFVPKEYDFKLFFEGIFEHQNVFNNHKYVNNYTYNKTVYLMQNAKLWDNGFLLLKEDIGLSSPIGVVYFEYYDKKETLQDRLLMDKNHIQCIIGNDFTPFGTSQSPKINEFADGIDTMQFLIDLT